MPSPPAHSHIVFDLPKTEYRWVKEQASKPAKPSRQKGDIITELARALDKIDADKAILHPLADFGRFRPVPRKLVR